MNEPLEVDLEPELLEYFRKFKPRDQWLVVEVIKWLVKERAWTSTPTPPKSAKAQKALEQNFTTRMEGI